MATQVTYNYLRPNMPIEHRGSNLVFLKSDNGRTFDIGWYPANDPTGQFVITVRDEHQEIVDRFRTYNLEGLIEAVNAIT